jgi:hypothetical protein
MVRPTRLDGKLKRRARRFNRGIVNLLLWSSILLLIQASALDPHPLTAATQGPVPCTGLRPFPSSLNYASPNVRSSIERRAYQALCSSPSEAETNPKNSFQGFLERFEECCGRCYICQP